LQPQYHRCDHPIFIRRLPPRSRNGPWCFWLYARSFNTDAGDHFLSPGHLVSSPFLYGRIDYPQVAAAISECCLAGWKFPIAPPFTTVFLGGNTRLQNPGPQVTPVADYDNLIWTLPRVAITFKFGRELAARPVYQRLRIFSRREWCPSVIYNDPRARVHLRRRILQRRRAFRDAEGADPRLGNSTVCQNMDTFKVSRGQPEMDINRRMAGGLGITNPLVISMAVSLAPGPKGIRFLRLLTKCGKSAASEPGQSRPTCAGCIPGTPVLRWLAARIPLLTRCRISFLVVHAGWRRLQTTLSRTDRNLDFARPTGALLPRSSSEEINGQVGRGWHWPPLEFPANCRGCDRRGEIKSFPRGVPFSGGSPCVGSVAVASNCPPGRELIHFPSARLKNDANNFFLQWAWAFRSGELGRGVRCAVTTLGNARPCMSRTTQVQLKKTYTSSV